MYRTGKKVKPASLLVLQEFFQPVLPSAQRLHGHQDVVDHRGGKRLHSQHLAKDSKPLSQPLAIAAIHTHAATVAREAVSSVARSGPL